MNHWRRYALMGGVLLLAILFGCKSKESPEPTLVTTLDVPEMTLPPNPTASLPPTPLPTATEIPLAARVNGQPILVADFEKRMMQERVEQSLLEEGWDLTSPEGQAKLAQERQRVLDMMIGDLLYEQVAQANGIAVSDELVDQHVQTDIEINGQEKFDDWLAQSNMSAEDYWQRTRADLLNRQVYEYIQGQVASQAPNAGEYVHARHILVETRKEAEALLVELQNGSDFATLARAHSQDGSTRDNGGDLSFFGRGKLLAPEVEQAAFALEISQYSDVVQSDLGFHIVQVLERQERPLDENDKALMIKYLVEQWHKDLWKQADIERYIP